MKAALAGGCKRWAHARVMLVGEGRAGKTAVANSILGNGYQDTHSTVGTSLTWCTVLFTVVDVDEIHSSIGISQKMCNIRYSERNNGELSWEVAAQPEKAYEAAVASLMVGKDAEQPPGAVVIASSVTNCFSKDRVKRGISLTTLPVLDARVEELVENAGIMMSTSHQKLHENDKKETVMVQVDRTADEALVIKLLGDMRLQSTDITMTLFDYGGQSVFNVIHHLFLVPSGVYVLVFNMESLMGDEETRKQCLSYMRFWLNAITIHAADNSTDSIAPIFIVGTRKDLISDSVKHVEMSNIIYESFKDCRAWPSVVSNKNGTSKGAKTTLYFFPVDNTIHRNDPVIANMMVEVEKKLKVSRYTGKPIPLTWFKCMDNMTATKKTCLQLKEVKRIARGCGLLNDEEVHCFLFFLSEMGTLMWHDEPTLRDVVIMDPVKYLINPATIVICKHSPDGTDATSHELPAHKECQTKCFQDWPMFLKSGVVTEKMLDVLWKSFDAEHQTMLKALCLKFGLFVPLYDGATTMDRKYQVPALLKRCPEHILNSNTISASLYRNTFFLVFSPYLALNKLCPVITVTDLRQYSFLPGGLFERIIGKAIVWSQTTSSNDYDIHDAALYKDFGILRFGNISFSLRLMTDSGCIRVDVDSVSPHVIEARMTELVQQVMT